MNEERMTLLQGTRPTIGGSIVGVVGVFGEPSDRVRLWVRPAAGGETADLTVAFGDPVALEDGRQLIVDRVEAPAEGRRGEVLAARVTGRSL